MTQAFNLSQLANNLNTSGQLDATDGLTGVVPTGNLPTIPVSKGGTNLTATPSNGQIPIGNGSGYSLATLTAGTNITISNGSGAVTINATAGAPSTAQVLSAYAGATAGAVGTYVIGWAASIPGFNGTTAGSNVRYNTGGDTLSGTWRVMSGGMSSYNDYIWALWVRIS